MAESQDEHEVVGGVNHDDWPDRVHSQPRRRKQDPDEGGFKNLVENANLIRSRQKEVVDVA